MKSAMRPLSAPSLTLKGMAIPVPSRLAAMAIPTGRRMLPASSCPSISPVMTVAAIQSRVLAAARIIPTKYFALIYCARETGSVAL